MGWRRLAANKSRAKLACSRVWRQRHRFASNASGREALRGLRTSWPPARGDRCRRFSRSTLGPRPNFSWPVAVPFWVQRREPEALNACKGLPWTRTTRQPNLDTCQIAVQEQVNITLDEITTDLWQGLLASAVARLASADGHDDGRRRDRGLWATRPAQPGPDRGAA